MTAAVTETLVTWPGAVAFGVPVAPEEAVPSSALVFVAITRTVYCVPAVRLGIVSVTVVPLDTTRCRFVAS